MAGKLVLCRHGQSDWNLKNLFTGWTGRRPDRERASPEAVDAGSLLQNSATTSMSPTPRC